jgi:DNA-binding CsgD family transcriptional regulator
MTNHREMAFEAVLDALAAGILLTDPDGYVLYMNRSARCHVEATDAVCLVNHRLNAVNRSARTSLMQAVTEHACGEDAPPRARSVALPGIATKGLVVTVLPLDQSEKPSLQPDAAAAVFLEAPIDEVHLPSDAFADLYGLTRAELRLLMSISLTHDADKAAADIGVRKCTVKTHLSHIYAKTTTAKLSELLPLFMHSVLRHELTETPDDSESAH